MAQKIDQEVEEIFCDWEEHVRKEARVLLPQAKLLKNAVFGGKKIRGFLVILGFELAGKKIDKEILKAAAAIEILHAGFLIQDDFIDQSGQRRGKPALYCRFENKHEGTINVILLADIMIFLTTKIISGLKFSPDLKCKTLNFLSKTSLDTGLGQHLDYFLSRLGVVKKQQDVIQIHKLKTAEYTVINPLQIGAILGEGSDELLESIWQFGLKLGIAFQIRDDVLGVFGDEKELGKSVTSDIEENKNTLLITYALEHGTEEQKDFLDNNYGKKPLSAPDFGKIKRIFIDTGSLDFSEQEAKKLAVQAKKIIPNMAKGLDLRRNLDELTDFLVSRNY